MSRTASRVLRVFVFFAALVVSAAPAVAGVHAVDSAGLQSLLRSSPTEVFLLDVRTPGEWSRGHIPGAHLIPMNQVPERLGEIPQDRKVVVVCATGARSAAVARYLDGRGYPWVGNHEGGVYDWARRGLPMVR